METQERVAQVFPANKDISVKKSLSVKGLVSVVIAVAAFALSSVVTDPQSSLKLALLVAGVAMIVYGVIKLALGKKTVIYKATGDVLSQTDILFDSQEVVRLKRMVEDRQFDNIATLKLITGNKAGVNYRWVLLLIVSSHVFRFLNSSLFLTNLLCLRSAYMVMKLRNWPKPWIK